MTPVDLVLLTYRTFLAWAAAGVQNERKKVGEEEVFCSLSYDSDLAVVLGARRPLAEPTVEVSSGVLPSQTRSL